ncbi:unnamed protein product [Didymodactylos carnosus]|uniref:PiggyBac transposable element-derived protein domain-containing protein n=2 Tax=Didymodactylos carnosus TaxID=1234261 RepID=A0A8S2FS82_9BILA|nr:unnamed protein product [Didymodactylos carnosus]CAF4338848.1 unnamed protein product [Didymodactylos carnosus]
MVCEATSGYICNLEIYCAKGLKLRDTILNLMTPYFDLWHHLYMDNYYNSVENSQILLKHKIRICGAIRINRGVPVCLKTVQLKKGETVYRRKKDVLVQIWRSKNDVRIISTIHSTEMKESRNIDRATKEKIIKPVGVIDYNKYMKGVDQTDQYISYFRIARKTKKWTNRVFFYLLNCALFNGYRVYNNLNTKKMRYKKLLHAIARMWITDDIQDVDDDEENEENPGPSELRTRRAPKLDPPTRLSQDMKQHILEKIIGTGKIRHPQRRCRVCAKHNKRSTTIYICKHCNVPLHRGKCFTKYHTLKHY